MVEMRNTDFLRLKDLFDHKGPLIKRKKNTNDEDVNWLKIKRFFYGMVTDGLLYQYSMLEDSLQSATALEEITD